MQFYTVITRNGKTFLKFPPGTPKHIQQKHTDNFVKDRTRRLKREARQKFQKEIRQAQKKLEKKLRADPNMYETYEDYVDAQNGVKFFWRHEENVF